MVIFDPEKTYKGYHAFIREDGKTYGSFEVFYDDGSSRRYAAGWYWWACWPGYLPDGIPHGPWGTAFLAFANAREL